MKSLIFLLLLVALVGVPAVSQQQEPKDGDFCLPESHAEHVCHCLAMGGYKDCSEGKRSVETNKCAMYCRADLCGCCKYMDDLGKKQAPPKKPSAQ